MDLKEKVSQQESEENILAFRSYFSSQENPARSTLCTPPAVKRRRIEKNEKEPILNESVSKNQSSSAAEVPSKGIIHYPEGSDRKSYEGFMLNGVPHGIGKMTFANGAVFEGPFEKGNRIDGFGKFTGPNGVVAEGMYVNQKLHGQGEVVLTNGNSIKGCFVEGNLPKGTITYSKGLNYERYIGSLNCFKPHGFGGLRYADGSILKGTFENGSEHGSGTLTRLDGATTVGTWVRGKLHGKAATSYPAGCFIREIKGVYVDGILEKGTVVYSKKSVFKRYEGFLKGKFPHGVGQMVYANGDFYRGEFVNGVRHGTGQEKKRSGEVYTGAWVNGEASGKGLRVLSNGARLEGIFRKGLLSDGLISYPQGSMYKFYRGTLKNGLADGRGIRVYSDGRAYDGMFKKGVPHGQGKLLNGDGSVEYEGPFENGSYNRSRRSVQAPAAPRAPLTPFPDFSLF